MWLYLLLETLRFWFVITILEIKSLLVIFLLVLLLFTCCCFFILFFLLLLLLLLLLSLLLAQQLLKCLHIKKNKKYMYTHNCFDMTS